MTEAARLRRWSDSQHGAQNYIAWQLLVLVDITGTVQFVHFYFDLVCIFFNEIHDCESCLSQT